MSIPPRNTLPRPKELRDPVGHARAWAELTPEQRAAKLEWYRRETLRMRANAAALQTGRRQCDDNPLGWGILGFLLGKLF
jgi:hypothetical protein